MKKKRNRTGLTPDNVFYKPKYLVILRLINAYSEPLSKKKIKMSHLKWALIKEYRSNHKNREEKMESFFVSDFDKVLMEKVKIKNHFKKGLIKRLEEMGILTNNIRFTSEPALRKYVKNLVDLGLIEGKKDKKGYHYYSLTELGIIKTTRFLIHHTIDSMIPDDITTLTMLQKTIFAIWIDYQIKNKKIVQSLG